MINKGIATFTLDYGKCPKWLFERMVKLGREMIYAIVKEKGPDEFVRRIADPVWFQSLGTVLAFDWNASGLTTILTAALKEAIREQERDLGIFICGGKGKTSKKTPEQIEFSGYKAGISEENTKALVYNSRMAAKVDSSLIQDGFQIYHHTFFFSFRRGSGQAQAGAWSVVQQGMNIQNQTARRYHWYSKNINDMIEEPHTGITSDMKLKSALNMTSKESSENRGLSAELVSQNFSSLFKDIKILSKYYTPVSQMVELRRTMPSGQQKLKFLNLENTEFKWHSSPQRFASEACSRSDAGGPVLREDFSRSKYLQKILYKLCEIKPNTYEKLLATPGVGPKTIRALALVAEIIYGAKPSYEDPARYSFAHGGKDATPYPVDIQTYDQTIEGFTRLNKPLV